jgi:subtilisin family serine protease
VPTPRERLNAAITFFFDQLLPEATGKQLAQLPNPMVHPGAYAKHSGAAVTSSNGQSITPAFVLRVHPALALAGQTPTLTAEVPQTGGVERHLLYTRQAADHKIDSEEEIARTLADIDSFAEIFGAEKSTTDPPAPSAPSRNIRGILGTAGAESAVSSPAAVASPPAAGSTSPARAGDWAKAIVASRASLPDDLTTLTTVPAAFAGLAGDVPALNTVLTRFFTFNEAGKYYPRWAGAGRDGSNPAHLTAEYKRDNVRELQLERECLYLYAVLPESLLAAGGGLDPSAFREIVLRFDETSESPRPFQIAAIHSAKWRRPEAPFCDFVFVYTEEGLGIPLARDLRHKLSPELQVLLAALADPGADREALLKASPHTRKTEATWYISLHVCVEEDPEPVFPPAVLVGEEVREWNNIVAPIESIPELATMPSVLFIGTAPRMVGRLDLALPEVNQAAFQAKLAANKQGGAGVVVGIIDSGIDGSHAAFAGDSGSRIYAVWDQDPPASLTGKTPAQNYQKKAEEKAYSKMNWGVELTRSSSPNSVTQSQDPDGHGTHVASIAAGREVKDSSGNVLVATGAAPNATLVVVRSIGITSGSDDTELAVDYILNKAKELKQPCVINMSYGHHQHAHDGSDTETQTLYTKLTTKKKGAYRPGRIIVAAAGNERDKALHIQRTIAKSAGAKGTSVHLATFSLGSLLAPPKIIDDARFVVWMKNPFKTNPKSFPVGLLVWRLSMTPGLYPIPTFDSVPFAMLGEVKTAAFPALNTVVKVSSQSAAHINGDYSFIVVFRRIDTTKTIVRTDWNAQITNRGDAALDVHAWVANENSDFKDATAADRALLVGAPADGVAAISVAASTTKIKFKILASPTPIDLSGTDTLHEVAHFSSNGPLREASKPMKKVDGVAHEVNPIDVTAPGFVTLAALSAQAPAGSDAVAAQANASGTFMAGTSMASPLVTGLVANMLADDPTLTMPKVLDRLRNASAIPAASVHQPPATTGGAKPYSQLWGYGLIDASKLK